MTQQQREAAISNCPFCNHKAELIEATEAANEGAVCVECTHCHASGPVVWGVKDDPNVLAIESWNRREQLAACEKERDALRTALTMLYEETADYIRLNDLGAVHHNR